MKLQSLSLALVLAITSGLAGAQTTWFVDDDGPGDPFPGVSIPGNPAFSDPNEDGSPAHPFDDVYKGVAAAANGDTVLVLPSNFIGFYALTSPLDLQGKAITVKSSAGPLVTALDGIGIPGSSGVLIDSGEGPGTVLEGFTLQNFDRGSSPGASGGAMRISGASPTIRGCRFVNNHAYVGGGAYLGNSSATIEDCLFLGNGTVHQGGGFHSDASSPDLVRCTFDSNSSNFGGAALFRTAPGGLVEILECTFLSNQSLASYGGAIAKFDQGGLDVVRSTFVGNVAAGEGSAAHVHGGGTLRECLFLGNTAATGTVNLASGGGTGVPGTTLVVGSTFTQNVGGAVTEQGGAMILRNSIAWNDSPFEIGAGVTVTHSDVLGGWPGTGNIALDPQFTDPFGLDGVPGTLDDDLTLSLTSPCIDAGDTLALGGAAFPVDHAGNARAIDSPSSVDRGVASLWLTTDMGAYEYVPPPPCGTRSFSTAQRP